MGLKNLQLRARILHLTLALVLLVIGWSSSAETWSWAIPLRIIALYPLLTGVSGWSPVRSLWGSAKSLRHLKDGEDHG